MTDNKEKYRVAMFLHILWWLSGKGNPYVQAAMVTVAIIVFFSLCLIHPAVFGFVCVAILIGIMYWFSLQILKDRKEQKDRKKK